MKAYVYSTDHHMTGRHDRLILAIPDHMDPPGSIYLPSSGEYDDGEIEFTRDGDHL